MSIRNMKISISPEIEKQILMYCRDKDFKQHDLLLECAYQSRNDEVALLIVQSIETGLSYDVLSGRQYIPLNKNDFYKHRRKCIELFAERIEKSNYIYSDCINVRI